MTYDTVVIGGGGLKGIGFLGALQCLLDSSKLNHVHTFIGTSIGAVIGYLISIGYKPIEIMVIIHTEKTMEKLIQAMDVTYLTTHGGIINFCIFQDILEQLTIKKIGHLLNLGQLYNDYGKKLVCCTYNMTKMKVEYMDYESDPFLPCITALRMSSNLPFLFFPFEYEGCIYVDGGIYDNLPVSRIETGCRTIALYCIDHVRTNEQSDNNEQEMMTKTKKTNGHIFNIMNYIFEILLIPIYHLQESNLKNVKNVDIDIVGITVSIPIFSWKVSRSSKFDSFSSGYESMRNFLDKSSDQ